MKRIALLSILCLFAGSHAAHASSISPLTDGYSLNVGNTVLTTANTSYNSLTGNLSFSDGTATYTFAEVSLPPLVSALSITRTCVTLNLGGCSAVNVSVSNASFLNGLLTANTTVGAQMVASVNGSVPYLSFGSTASLGVQTALVGYQASSTPLPTNSPVPEPGTMGLVMSGLLSVVYGARRRFLNV